MDRDKTAVGSECVFVQAKCGYLILGHVGPKECLSATSTILEIFDKIM